MTNDKGNTPMGGDLPEDRTGSSPAPVSRNVWAIDTLIEEVVALFPGTKYETGSPNVFNANMFVAFTPAEENEVDLHLLLLTLEEVDERIATVQSDGDGRVIVGIAANPVLRDSRKPFGVKDAAVGLDLESADAEASDETDEEDEK